MNPMPVPGRRTCNGHCKDGRPCEGAAVTGAEKCRMHLGKKAGPVIAAAKAEAEARKLFGRLAPEVKAIENPLEAYAQLAGRVTAWVETMDGLIGQLSTVGYEHERNGEQIHAAVQLYTQSMRDANAVLGTYARLRIDERLAAITAAKVDMLMKALEAGLAEHGIKGAEATAIKQATGRHLRIVKSA